MPAPRPLKTCLCCWYLALPMIVILLALAAVTTVAMKKDDNTAVLSPTIPNSSLVIMKKKLKESLAVQGSNGDSDNIPDSTAELKQLYLPHQVEISMPDPHQDFDDAMKQRLHKYNGQRLLSDEDSFSCPNPQWNQVGQELNGEAAGDRFGMSGVALSANGQIMAVGAPYKDGMNGVDSGGVSVFRRNDTDPLGWVQVGQDLDGEGAGDLFGGSVALSDNGEVLVVGAIWNQDCGQKCGHVRIFKRDSLNPLGWTQLGHAISGDNLSDWFGTSISVSGSGEIIAIGAHQRPMFGAPYGRHGYVRIYKRNPLSALGWDQLGQDLIGESPDDRFGHHVALSNDGEVLAVGAVLNDGVNGEDSGHVQVFQKNSTVNLGWTKIGGNIDGEAADDLFGWQVALSNDGEVLAISARNNDGVNGADSSHVRIFQRDLNSIIGWAQIGQDLDGEAAGDISGHNMVLSDKGDIVAIGSPYGDDYGHVRIYRQDSSSSLGWAQVGNDIVGTGNYGSNEWFSHALAISSNGEVLAIGANGNGDGFVKVFQACNQTLSTIDTDTPSTQPTQIPSTIPSSKPSDEASNIPTLIPSIIPSAQPSLDQFSWYLKLVTVGYLKDPPLQDGVQEFVTTYNMSDRHYGIEVFKDDCQTPSTGLPLVTTDDSKANGINTLQASFIYNQTIIQSSNLWTANSTGGDVDFCIKLSLYTNTNVSDQILFNFIETVYKVEVDLTTGFTSSVDVIRTEAGDGGVEVIDVNENITAFQCNDAYDELTSPSPLTQGDSLQVCVETESDSVFEVGNIKDVTISQNGTKSFNYVASYEDSYWAVTSCMAVNTTASKCKVKVQLLGEYFNNADPVDLIVEGVVKLDYLGRRMLHTIDDGMRKRNLVGGEEKKNSVFTVNVPLAGPGSTTMDKEDVSDFSAPEENQAESNGASVHDDLSYESIFLALMVVGVTGVAMKMMK